MAEQLAIPDQLRLSGLLGDNGNILSSYNSPAGLTVTLPSTGGLPDGWSMGFATDNNKSLTIQVASTSGGRIV